MMFLILSPNTSTSSRCRKAFKRSTGFYRVSSCQDQLDINYGDHFSFPSGCTPLTFSLQWMPSQESSFIPPCTKLLNAWLASKGMHLNSHYSKSASVNPGTATNRPDQKHLSASSESTRNARSVNATPTAITTLTSTQSKRSYRPKL